MTRYTLPRDSQNQAYETSVTVDSWQLPLPERRENRQIVPLIVTDELVEAVTKRPSNGVFVRQEHISSDEPIQRTSSKGVLAQPLSHPTPQDTTLDHPNIHNSEPIVSDEQMSKEHADKNFLLQIVQPGLVGLMDGSVSTLAPIFAVAFATHQPFITFLVGMASALGAGISMAFSEALSDDGDLTGRGNPFIRGSVTGIMTFLSGAGHALPFLIPNLQIALFVAYAVVVIELLGIAAIRHKFFGTNWWLSIGQVVGGGALVFAAALLLGSA
jgi:erythrin-vacuolar iron transport family protein